MIFIEFLKQAYLNGTAEARNSKRLEELFELEKYLPDSESVNREIDEHIDKSTRFEQPEGFLERIFYEAGYAVEMLTDDIPENVPYFS